MSLLDKPEHVILGKWKNQLGSVMEIDDYDEKKQTFEGTYYTSVGNVKKGIGNDLTGTYSYKSYSPENAPTTVSFFITWTVHWKKTKDITKPPSCTTWNAQLVLKDNKEPVQINATWILRRHTLQKDCWDGPLIGKGVFEPMKNTKEKVK